MECPALPETPQPVSQKDVAVYVVKLEASARVCRQALEEVQAWSILQVNF
jgi:hypothetical protein